MALRTVKTGKNEGKQFWGFTGYPDCKVVVNIWRIGRICPVA